MPTQSAEKKLTATPPCGADNVRINYSDQPILSTDSLSYAYASGQGGVSDVSFHVEAGEFFCLLGPSGCGKTTLLRLIAGLIKPQSGAIHFNCPLHYGPGGIGMMFQDLALFPHMSAARNVSYGLRHLPAKQRRARADEYLQLVGLLDYRAAYPHELSGGQKQRLALARALAPQPAILMLDEPFGSQDVYLRAQLRDDLLHILKDKKIAALMVTHDPEEAMFLADRIGIMRDGLMHQIGTPDQLYTTPKDDYTAGFFGYLNMLNGVVQNGLIDTPLGIFNAPHLSNDTHVKIAIRPDAMRLQNHDGTIDHTAPAHRHTHGKIVNIRTLGTSTYLHLDECTDEGTESGIHFHVRTNASFIPNDDVQDIFVDTDKAYIFPQK